MYKREDHPAGREKLPCW